MADAICMGELLIDFVPVTTGTDLLTAPAFQKAAGGAPANVAGLARLGTSTALMCRASEDGLAVSWSRRWKMPASIPHWCAAPAAPALRWPSCHWRKMPSASSCSTAIPAPASPEDVDFNAIAKAKLVHFGSIGLIPEQSCAATLDAVDAARGHGLHVSFDANLRLDLWPTADAAREAIIEGIERATIVKLSDDELEFLTGSRDPSVSARKLFHPGLTLMVVTHGRHGCTFVTTETTGKAPASPSFPSIPPEPATPSWLAF